MRSALLSRLSAFTLLLWLPVLTGCGTVHNLSAKATQKQRQKAMAKITEASVKEADRRLGATAIGAVTWADEVSGFVQVKVRAGKALASGTKLDILRGGQKVAEVTVAPEAKLPFIIADIMSGSPARGDTAVPASGNSSSAQLVPIPDEPAETGAAAVPKKGQSPASQAANPAGLPDLPPLDGPGAVEEPGEAVRIQKPEDVLRDRAPARSVEPPPAVQ